MVLDIGYHSYNILGYRFLYSIIPLIYLALDTEIIPIPSVSGKLLNICSHLENVSYTFVDTHLYLFRIKKGC